MKPRTLKLQLHWTDANGSRRSVMSMNDSDIHTVNFSDLSNYITESIETMTGLKSNTDFDVCSNNISVIPERGVQFVIDTYNEKSFLAFVLKSQ